MSRQPFAFSSEDDERSLSPLSLSDRGEQQQVNDEPLTSLGRVLSNNNNNNPQRDTISRFPCKARGLPSSHNARSAYIDIPPDAAHGTILTCSHAECRSSGRRFRFCAVCHFPVARRNFADRHSHGMLERPPRFEQDLNNKKRDPGIAMVDAMQDITAKRRAAELLLEDLKVQERLIYMRWGRNPPVDGDADDDENNNNNNNETNMGDNNGNQHAVSIMEHIPVPGDQLHPNKLVEPPNLYVDENHGNQMLSQRGAEPNHYMASNNAGEQQLYQQRVQQPSHHYNNMVGNNNPGVVPHAEPNHWNNNSFAFSTRYHQPQEDTLDGEPDSLRKRHKGADTIFRVVE